MEIYIYIQITKNIIGPIEKEEKTKTFQKFLHLIKIE